MQTWRDRHPENVEYQRNYAKAWRARNRTRVKYHRHKGQHDRMALIRQTVAQFKLSKGCALCGYKTNADALQFDHIIPLHKTGGKRYESLVSWATMEKVLTDPNVQVLCANCHSIKTVRERREMQAERKNAL